MGALAVGVGQALRDPRGLVQASPGVADLTHLVGRLVEASQEGRASSSDAASGDPAAHDSSPRLSWGHSAAADVPHRVRLQRIVRAYATGQSTEELWPQYNIRMRFWLPETLEEAWKESWSAYTAITGIINETVGVAEFIEFLIDAYMQQWAAEALADMRRHPIIDDAGWMLEPAQVVPV